jgi:TonB family protein
VAFSISPDGTLGTVSVARSSGVKTLDQAALALMRKVFPFTDTGLKKPARFTINIRYSLGDAL